MVWSSEEMHRRLGRVRDENPLTEEDVEKLKRDFRRRFPDDAVATSVFERLVDTLPRAPDRGEVNELENKKGA